MATMRGAVGFAVSRYDVYIYDIFIWSPFRNFIDRSSDFFAWLLQRFPVTTPHNVMAVYGFASTCLRSAYIVYTTRSTRVDNYSRTCQLWSTIL